MEATIGCSIMRPTRVALRIQYDDSGENTNDLHGRRLSPVSTAFVRGVRYHDSAAQSCQLHLIKAAAVGQWRTPRTILGLT